MARRNVFRKPPLLHRFEFPEVKPHALFELLRGQRLIVGERAEEGVGDYYGDDGQKDNFVNNFRFGRQFFGEDVVEDKESQNEGEYKRNEVMVQIHHPLNSQHHRHITDVHRRKGGDKVKKFFVFNRQAEKKHGHYKNKGDNDT